MSVGFGFDWKDSNGVVHSVFVVETTAAGDLIIGTGNPAQATERLPIGSDGAALLADSSRPLGLRWGNIAGGGIAPAFSRDITQASHGFTVGNVLRLSGAAYVLAQADNAVDAEVLGIVSAVIDVNNFTMILLGYVTGLSGLSPGLVYFLDPVAAGAITPVEPTTSGQVNKALLVADSATSGYFSNDRGVAVP